MNGCYYNEKTSDEMFSDTRYYKQTDYKENNKIQYIDYRANMNEHIKFYYEDKYLYIDGKITMQELAAINKKVQELGWIHEREEKENA